MCVASRAEIQNKEPDLIFMVSKSGSLDSHLSTLSLLYGLPKNITHGTMFAWVEIKRSRPTSNGSETLKSRTFTPITPSNLLIPKMQRSIACGSGRVELLRKIIKIIVMMEWQSWTLDSYHETSKQNAILAMSAADSRTQQENHGSSTYDLTPRAFRKLHSYKISHCKNTEPAKKALYVCARPGRDLPQETVQRHANGVGVLGGR